jgi:hypothetical protein
LKEHSQSKILLRLNYWKKLSKDLQDEIAHQLLEDIQNELARQETL